MFDEECNLKILDKKLEMDENVNRWCFFPYFF